MIEMQVVNTKVGRPRDGGTLLNAFEAEASLVGISISDYVLIPSEVNSISVTVSFTGGATGYVEATTDIIDKVVAETATWLIWNQGEVSVTTQDSAYPPSAIRAIQSGAGTMKMSVRAQ